MNFIEKTMRMVCSLALATGFAAVPLRAAAPPALSTPEETMWKNVSQASQSDFGSAKTLDLMNQFFKKYNDHPKSILLRYMFAERSFKAGQFQNAAAGYEKFLLLYPKHPLADSAAYRLGECYYNLGIFNSAKAAWERLVANYAASGLVPNALEQLAQIHMRAGEWGKADERFKLLKTRYPEYAAENHVREAHGIVQYQFQDYDTSASTLDGVGSERASFYRGLDLFSLKLFDDAVASLNEAARAPGGAFAEQAAYLKAESFFQKKNYPVASAEFSAFLKRYPAGVLTTDAELRKAASALLTDNAAEALRLCEKVAVKEKGVRAQGLARFIKGIALMQLNRYAEAVQVFGAVANDKDDLDLQSAALLRQAWGYKLLQKDKEEEAALSAFTQRYANDPQMMAVLYLQGAQLFEKGKWEDAGNYFERSVHGYPYSALSEAGLAMMTVSYAKAGRNDRTVTGANSILKLFEKNFSSESLYWRALSYFNVGRAYEEMDHFKDALSYYENVTLHYGDHPLAPNAQLRLAWCLALTGNSAKAREKAKELIDQPKTAKPLAVNASFLIAATYFNDKNYDQALVGFAEFLKANPADDLSGQAQYLMGLSYHQKKVFGSAIDEWSKLILTYPSHPLTQDAYLQIGDLYFKAGDFEKSADYFARFQQKYPTSPYAELALWQELQSYFNGKADEKAIKLYPLYINRTPLPENVADARNQLEMVYYRRGAHGDPDKLQEFLAQYPKSPFAPAARFKLGDMALEQKQWERASSEMEQFVRDYPKDPMLKDALYGLGMAYENAGDVEKAVVQYRQLMTQFSDKPAAADAAFRLGSLHFKKERYKEAADAYEFAAKKKMSDELRGNLANNMALCYENMGRHADAAIAYGNVAKYSKDAAVVRESLMSAGLLMKKAEQPAQAIPYFEKLLKDPGDAHAELQALNFLAECYRSAGQTNNAIQTYEKLVGTEPAADDLRLTGLAQLAYLYEQKKQMDKALRIYEKIAISDGKQEWVKAAQDRMTQLSAAANVVP